MKVIISQESQFFKDYDFKLIYSNTNNISLAGFPAYQIVYTTITPQSVSKLSKYMETGTIIGNLGYRIQYDTDLSLYSSNYKVAKKIIDSLQVNPAS